MSYFRKSGRAMGAWSMVSVPTAPTTTTIEMADDFVGNVNNLPICPKTDQNGWCRKYVGGSAVKMAVNYSPTTSTVKPATTTTSTVSASTTNAVSSVLSSIFGAITSPAKLPGAPTVVQTSSGGMSTTTKVALAGGAVLLVALLARR